MCVKYIVHLVGMEKVSEISENGFVVERVHAQYDIKFITLSIIMEHNVLRLWSCCQGNCGSIITFLVCE
jgi:hypothetical protein